MAPSNQKSQGLTLKLKKKKNRKKIPRHDISDKLFAAVFFSFCPFFPVFPPHNHTVTVEKLKCGSKVPTGN